jgi:hypothetical protein
MDVPLQNQYKKFVKTLQQYEKVIGEKLQLRSIKIKDLKSFVDYLIQRIIKHRQSKDK